MSISIIGFGKLGSSTGYFLSNKKIKIYAYDINKKILEGFENKRPLFYEKSSEKLIKKNKINFCYSIEEAIKKSSITYLVLPTPSIKATNKFNPKFIYDSIDKIFPILKKKKTKHTIIITSTVFPGTCNNFINYIYNKFKMKDFIDYRFIYNPYFIALGSIINDLEKPDLLLVGSHPKNINFYKKYLEKIYNNKIKKINLNFLNFQEAEISKLAINCYVTMKISFSNLLSQIADKRIGKLNTSKILKTIGSDSRIGQKYLGLGPMYSGPCFPRDNLAMLAFFKDLKISGDLFNSTDKINNLQTTRLIKIINDVNKFNDKRIGFLGLTYKSGTDLFTDSPAFYIISNISSKKRKKISGYDPYFKKKVKKEISQKYKIRIHDSLDTFIKTTDVIFLSYRDRKFSKIIKYKNKVFIDPWNFLNRKNNKSKIISPGIS